MTVMFVTNYCLSPSDVRSNPPARRYTNSPSAELQEEASGDIYAAGFNAVRHCSESSGSSRKHPSRKIGSQCWFFSSSLRTFFGFRTRAFGPVKSLLQCRYTDFFGACAFVIVEMVIPIDIDLLRVDNRTDLRSPSGIGGVNQPYGKRMIRSFPTLRVNAVNI